MSDLFRNKIVGCRVHIITYITHMTISVHCSGNCVYFYSFTCLLGDKDLNNTACRTHSLSLLPVTDICVKDCSLPRFTPGVLHICDWLIALETAAQNTLLISPIELCLCGWRLLYCIGPVSKDVYRVNTWIQELITESGKFYRHYYHHLLRLEIVGSDLRKLMVFKM